MNILTVDFDFFFPTPSHDSLESFKFYDWGMREAPFFIDGIWEYRAAEFLSYNMPLPGTSGEEEGFWDRFTYSPRCSFFYGDSHLQMLDRRILPNRRERTRTVDVWNYDAHHDIGYDEKKTFIEWAENRRWDCSDWGVFYALLGAKIHVRFPGWMRGRINNVMQLPIAQGVDADLAIDDGSSPEVAFDRVYLCRSGAWTPSWLEGQFKQLVEDFPKNRRHELGDMKWREFDREGAVAAAKTLKGARAGLMTTKPIITAPLFQHPLVAETEPAIMSNEDHRKLHDRV